MQNGGEVMLSIPNLVTYYDIIRLPKNVLKEICSNLNLSDNGTSFELAVRIWTAIQDNPELQCKALQGHENKILAGKTSISWFEFINSDGIKGLKNILIKNNKTNPFEVHTEYSEEDLNNGPILKCAAETNNKNKYYLRYIYKSGTTANVSEEGISFRPATSMATVFIDEEKQIIEIRSNPNDALKIARHIAGVAKQQITLSKKDIVKPFGYDTAKMADELGGQLYQSKAIPELILEDLTESQTDAVVNVLAALDRYFEEEDINVLQAELQNAKSILGEELLTIPFVSVVLSGMGNIGLKVKRDDLRSTPLYNLLEPHLQPQGGYIRFDVEEDGIKQTYTIQVGVTTKSVFFSSPSTTEKVIEYVRERIII